MEHISVILQNKELKAKVKSILISQLLADREITVSEWLTAAANAKDPDKAICLEALELTTKATPQIVEMVTIKFVISCLSAKAPRVKLEAARVIANCIRLFSGIDLMESTADGLLANTTHPGTVVRWSAATALAEVAKLPESEALGLRVKLSSLAGSEDNNSIRKIYEKALKLSNKH
jgi:hypothetical protein